MNNDVVYLYLSYRKIGLFAVSSLWTGLRNQVSVYCCGFDD